MESKTFHTRITQQTKNCLYSPLKKKKANKRTKSIRTMTITRSAVNDVEKLEPQYIAGEIMR